MTASTVSMAEIDKFDRLAGQWWDPEGPMKPLHRMNPARVAWIDGVIGNRRRLLDVGCGAGLAAEALARLGYDVLGIDAAGEAIEAARAHAAGQGLALRYRDGVAEDLLAEGLRFPAATCLEVVEHVPDPGAFIRVLADLLEPGGILVMSTLNRTPRSFFTAKLGAEYVLRMLPIGTHDWRRFITPKELASMMRAAGLRVGQATGLVMDPLTWQWRTSRNMGVNYLMAGMK
ncbi:MAG: bifunctional 2-polyprenyl-6-hydroxyphenol methylase/3-demethylubiquinol 3-O-methyltransferase UbiG [Proteobacteria bacterium]|nr:bifunctional 2-polyprenyl-6-hydroxyphenol methylase/3-demethylubiquinol 3-O-methyltransferase UbiG [Pseudomonadota bacterium]